MFPRLCTRNGGKTMTKSEKKTVLVTRASTGIGLALAKRLAADGRFRAILTARAQSLGRFAMEGLVDTTDLRVRPLDVTVHAERVAIIREASDSWGGVDILVNNAGVSYRSVVEHAREKDRLAQMNINFRAPMDLVRLVLPSMRRKRSGRIINVSSVGGMMAMPTMSVYSASKFALEGATEALWYEVRPWNIKVSLVEPGFVRSNSFENTRATSLSGESVLLASDPYHHHYANMAPFVARWMGRARATPDTIARRIIKTMTRKRPPLRVEATIDARMFSLIRRVVPRRLYHWLLYRSLPNVKTWGDRVDVPASLSSGKHTGYDLLGVDVDQASPPKDKSG